MADLANLIERVEKLTGPDQALARVIQTEIGGWHRVTPAQGGGKHGKFIAPNDWIGRQADGRPILDGLHGTYMHADVPDCTASLDAVVALVERVKPGWGFYLRSDKEGNGCGLVYPDAFRVTPCHCMGATPAIAMLLALLRSMEADNG